MRFAALVVAFGLCCAQDYAPTPAATTAGDYGTTAGGGAGTTAGDYGTTAGDYGTTAGGDYGTTAPPVGDYGTTAGGDYGQTTPRPKPKHTTPRGGGGRTTLAPTFRCRQQKGNFTYQERVVDLDPILSLEGYCTRFSRDAKCSGGDPKKGGLVGNLVENVVEVSGSLTGPVLKQVTCILDLNVLNLCDVDVIVNKLVQYCPKGADRKALCISACACCGDKGSILDACVNLCLTNEGKLNVNVDPLRVLDGEGKGDGLPNVPFQEKDTLLGLDLDGVLGALGRK